MATGSKIDSNNTSLAYAEEQSIGVLPSTPTWKPLEPNSYNDFGGQVTTIARNPINAGRQRKKGVISDLDASGGFNTDLTQSNLEDLMQGFFFADARKKAVAEDVTSVTLTNTFTKTGDFADFNAGDLVLAAGFTDPANNGLHIVTSVTNDTVVVTSTLVNETAPAGATVTMVGIRSDAGDIDVDASGTLPRLTSSTFDFDDLGVIPGEFVYIGGDEAGSSFGTSANNGFCRVRSVSSNELVFDKTQSTMVTESTTTERIRIFVGSVLKNETGSLINCRTYQLERQLGAPDAAQPSQIQSEYLVGSVPSEFTANLSTSDKVNCDLSFVSTNSEQRTATDGVKSGNRPALVEADAFNTSSDVSVVKLAKVVSGDASPTALFAFAESFDLTINNNVTPNKAIGTLGSFSVTAGTFEVGGNMTVYFGDIEAVQAVRNNDDITFEFHIAKQNAGVSVDLPLITLGDGRPNVEQDQAIKLPLTNQAATGAKVHPDLDHTLLMVFWPYLPTAAA